MREQIADLGLFEAHVADLFDAIPNGRFDIQPLLERLTVDIATEFLFGESVLSLRNGSLFSRKEMTHFVEAFYAAEKTTAQSIFYGDLVWLIHDRKFKEQCKIVHDFVDTYVERRLKEEKRQNRYVVLDALVSDVKDPKELRTQLLHILLAGSDTISGTLGFTVASLAQHPRVFKKLRQIVLEDFRGVITLSGLKNCTYLQWCLNEVLRVYPAVPVNFREAVRDTTLPVGGGDGTAPVFVPKGHLVAWEVSCVCSCDCADFLSSGQCIQIRNFGATMPKNSSQNDGRAGSLVFTTCRSMPGRGSVSDNSLRLLKWHTWL